jgi:hypothetical protein
MICLNRTMDSELLFQLDSPSLNISKETRRQKMRMSRFPGLMAAFLVLCGMIRPALAETWVYVPDMSQMKYQLAPGGLIYFRNLNDFSSAALGCCYNYWLDTTTQDGRNSWATCYRQSLSTRPCIWGIQMDKLKATLRTSGFGGVACSLI